MSPLMRLRDVGVRYRVRRGHGPQRHHDALQGVSFDLQAGESLGVIGGNGAGKSTLLRLLAGVIKPDYGSIETRGARVGLLSLQLGFDVQLSGRDNALIGGMLLGMRRREVRARLDEIVAFAGLEAVIDEPLHTYSTGMRARLGFAVALQMRPDVLLIDESLGVGDQAFAQKASSAIEGIVRSDRTVVLVSHSLATIRTLCDRALWLEQGRMRMVGEVQAVADAYGQCR